MIKYINTWSPDETQLKKTERPDTSPEIKGSFHTYFNKHNLQNI